METRKNPRRTRHLLKRSLRSGVNEQNVDYASHSPAVNVSRIERRFINAGLVLAVPVALLGLLVLVQNPHVRPALWTPPELTRLLQESQCMLKYLQVLEEKRSRAKQLVGYLLLKHQASQHHAVGGAGCGCDFVGDRNISL